MLIKKIGHFLKNRSEMDELKSLRSADRESERSKIIGFKSQRYFLKAVFSIIWTQYRIILTEDRTFPKVTVWFVCPQHMPSSRSPRLFRTGSASPKVGPPSYYMIHVTSIFYPFYGNNVNILSL